MMGGFIGLSGALADALRSEDSLPVSNRELFVWLERAMPAETVNDLWQAAYVLYSARRAAPLALVAAEILSREGGP